MTQAQRKQGMGGLFRPVSWNKGRRFTSPGPEVNSANKNVGIQNYEVNILCILIWVSYTPTHNSIRSDFVL